MKHLELHIIQSVPVACLNRDDLNSPKTAVFGGVQRARVSSQSWKRAIRDMAKEMSPDLFKGNRTRRMVFELKKRFVEKGISAENAVAISEHIAGIIETLDSKKDEAGLAKIKTLMFFSEAEYDAMAAGVVDAEDVKENLDDLSTSLDGVKSAESQGSEMKKAAKKSLDGVFKRMKTLSKNNLAKLIKSAQLKDAADIALFGRMVANDHSLTVEAASMFSHPLSTHKADNEIDFFAAVDDLQTKDESGAGMTGTLEYNSATYYRFAALNLDMLRDKEHLEDMTKEERREIVKAFIDATIKAIPTANQYTKNANTLPAYVLGVIREAGHPIQLVNAFESPVRPSPNGFVVESINRLNAEFADLKDTWGIESNFSKAVVKNSLKENVGEGLGEIQACSLSELVEGMANYVD